MSSAVATAYKNTIQKMSLLLALNLYGQRVFPYSLDDR